MPHFPAPRRLFARNPSRIHHLSRHRLRPRVDVYEDRTLMASAFTVTALTDTGAGSGTSGDLRYCITQADKAGGTIGFGVMGTIELTSALPALNNTTQPVNIVGPGASVLTVQGNGSFSDLSVSPGTTATVAGLTLTGGGSSTGTGGGINNSGILTLTNDTIAGNSASTGGGIANSATLTLTNASISNNTASNAGGIDNAGTINATGSTIAGNVASAADANAHHGGGIRNSGTLNLTSSTVSGNSAGLDHYVPGIGIPSGNYGGGVDNSGSLTLTNSTVSGNSANFINEAFPYGPLNTSFGGGINNVGSLTLTNATIANNSARTGGLATSGTPPPVLVNTIVASNSGGDIAGSVHTAASSHNLIGTGGTGGLTSNNNNFINVSSPMLGTLGNYGGPTQTIPLLPGSLALDYGLNTGTTATTDQRGDARVVNGTIDIGAFESRGFTITAVAGSSPQSAPLRTAFANPLAVVVASPYGEPVAGGFVGFDNYLGAGVTLGQASVSAAATIGADGRAAVTASAGSTVGSSTVIAFSSGVNPNFVYFTLNNQTTATGTVGVGWGTAGTATLQTQADGLRLLPSGRTTDLPWLGINKITVTLAQAATLAAGDIRVTGINVANYGPVTISGSGSTYTITLAQPINTADRVTITIANSNSNIATFTRRLDVLPGDVNDDGVVNAQDGTLERNAILAGITSLLDDIDGDGTVSINDYNLVRRKVGTQLPPLG